MTLIELMLALTITGLVGVGVVSMLVAASNGTDMGTDLRGLTVRGRTVTARINQAIHTARSVWETGDHFLVLWTEDRDGDMQCDADERARLEYDPAGNQLRFAGQIWARGVTGLTVRIDQPDAPSRARLVNYRLSLQAGDMTRTVIQAAALR